MEYKFKLTIVEDLDQSFIEGFRLSLQKVPMEDIKETGYRYFYNFAEGYPQKWLDYDDDMRTFSQRYPEVTLLLSAEGETLEDNWSKSYRNGIVL